MSSVCSSESVDYTDIDLMERDADFAVQIQQSHNVFANRILKFTEIILSSPYLIVGSSSCAKSFHNDLNKEMLSLLRYKYKLLADLEFGFSGSIRDSVLSKLETVSEVNAVLENIKELSQVYVSSSNIEEIMMANSKLIRIGKDALRKPVPVESMGSPEKHFEVYNEVLQALNLNVSYNKFDCSEICNLANKITGVAIDAWEDCVRRSSDDTDLVKLWKIYSTSLFSWSGNTSVETDDLGEFVDRLISVSLSSLSHWENGQMRDED